MIRSARFVTLPSALLSTSCFPRSIIPFVSPESALKRNYSTPGKKTVKINLTTDDGTKVDFECGCTSSHSLMNAIRDIAKLDMMGMCEGCLECATCHAVLSEDWFKKIAPPSSKEQDFLDQLPNAQPTSRLCCQIPMIEEMNGIEVTLVNPAM